MSSVPMRLCASALLYSLCLPSLSAQWQAVPTTTLPPPRIAPAIGEGLEGQLLLFGGQQGANARNDLWQFTGTQWVAQPTPPVAPRSGAALAFDRERNQLVLFGGRIGNVFLGDTQLFDGTTWTQSPATGPSARSEPGLVYDTRRQVVVLFGGNDSGGALADHWEWSGSAWTQVFSATTPPPIARPTMTYDQVRQEVAMMPGQSASQFFVYDGTDWSQPSGNLPPLQTPRIAADPIRGRLLAVGVTTAGVETWEWDGLAWRQVAATAPTSLVPSQGNLAFDRQRGEIVFLDANHNVSGLSLGPQPLALPFGVPCVDPARQLRPTAGSSAEPGTNVLLETTAVPQGVLGFGIAGTSRTQSGGTSLPTPFAAFNPNGCDQQVAITAITLLPNVSSTFLWQLPIPNNASLLGAQLQTQVAMLGSAGIVDATNGLEVQVGSAPDEQVAIESFTNEAGRDPLTSGDRWQSGSVQPVGLGGDGRHGSFDPAVGLVVGPNVFQFSTDKQVLPGSLTLSGNSETVVDGQFHFTDFKIPANVTVRFRGSHPAILRVRGAIEILGKLDLNGARMTRFNAQNPLSAITLIPGQDGGVGGPGGGSGGRGGNRCQGTGPTVVNGVIQENGRAGEVVQVAAGHAYALQATGTPGQGGLLFPAHGISSQLSFNASFVFNGDVGRGGGGGGFATVGNSSSIGQPLTNFVYGPATPGGLAFPIVQGVVTPPQGSSSLEHFTVGGSGGGGGGSHPMAALSTSIQPWKAGAGGSGGGGAAALRSGGTTHIGANGSITARGGGGVVINGDNPNTPTVELITQPTSWGASSPGGGGSGGSVLLQSANDLEVFGSLDTGGGDGSSTGGISPPTLNARVFAGAGSDGFVRLEALGQVSTPGTFVPPLTTQGSTGPLLDRDSQSGSRSTWRQTSGTELPVFVRYELLVDVNGQTQLFSDDPSLGAAPADDPAGPVRLRLQTARSQANGLVDPTSIGPWRDYAGSQQAEFGLSHDRGDLFRFDLVINDTVGTVSIRELRVVWR